MTDFGDATPDDSYDVTPADPEAVARIFWSFLHNRAPKKYRKWEAHSTDERSVIIGAFRELLSRLRREGSA